MDSSTYQHLFGQIKNSCSIPHYFFPCHNLISVETVQQSREFLNDFPCYHPFPYTLQLSSVLFCGSRRNDDAAELVKKKSKWEKKLKTLTVPEINRAIKTVKLMRGNKVVSLSQDLKKFINHFSNDPEPMFCGNYNWLYTGGCLSFDEDLVCGDFILGKPGFNIFQLDPAHSKIAQNSFTQLKALSPILQIVTRSHNNNIVICARQKQTLSLFKSDRTNTVKLWRKKVAGLKLLTSVDVRSDCEKLILTDSKYDINVFDVEKKNKIYGESGKKIRPSDVDCWSQVEFGDCGVFWAFRNQFMIVDLRDSLDLKLTYNPSAVTNACEYIAAFVKSKIDSNYIYLATNHHVMQLDLRKGKPIQRWTHLMKSPPQFMSTVKDEDHSEIILLQSSSVDEIIGICNDGSSVSKSLPCLLKSIKESLNLARISGVCLSPSAAKRVEYSVTGMQCLKNKQGDMTLFTTNSGGDVFFGKITKKNVSEDENKEEVLKSMESYESRLRNFPPKKLNVKFVDMSRVLKEIQNTRNKYKKVRKSVKAETHWKYHEMYAIDSLKDFQDVLAHKILKVWLPSAEEPENDESVLSAEAKVREWMNKN